MTERDVKYISVFLLAIALMQMAILARVYQ